MPATKTAPARPKPPLPPRLAERALEAANGDGYAALWAAVVVYRRVLKEAGAEAPASGTP